MPAATRTSERQAMPARGPKTGNRNPARTSPSAEPVLEIVASNPYTFPIRPEGCSVWIMVESTRSLIGPPRAATAAAATELPLLVTNRGALLFARKGL